MTIQSRCRPSMLKQNAHNVRGVLNYLVAVSMLLSACSSASDGTKTDSANAPAASEAVAARQQIGAAAARIWEAVARGDSAAILSDYAEDAIVLGSGGPMLQGKPAVAAFLQRLFAENTLKDVKGDVTDITISVDLAVETGTYAMTLIPKNGSAVADKGKYIHVWKRFPDGSWKVARYIANSDIAPK